MARNRQSKPCGRMRSDTSVGGDHPSPALLTASGLTDNDFADLDDRRLICVVRNVSHDLLCMRAEARLKGLHRVTEDVAHAYVGGGVARTSTSQSPVHRVELAAIPHASLNERHVLVPVIRMVESSAGLVRVHHTDFDHLLPPDLGPHRPRNVDRARDSLPSPTRAHRTRGTRTPSVGHPRQAGRRPWSVRQAQLGAVPPLIVVSLASNAVKEESS
jgi:hypothetical protein